MKSTQKDVILHSIGPAEATNLIGHICIEMFLKKKKKEKAQHACQFTEFFIFIFFLGCDLYMQQVI